MSLIADTIFEIEVTETLLLDADGDRPFLQVSHEGRRGRKWWLSTHMTRSEIVRTAFMAVLAYREHELREEFRWRDARVFSPHIDVARLRGASMHEDRRREEPGAWERET